MAKRKKKAPTAGPTEVPELTIPNVTNLAITIGEDLAKHLLGWTEDKTLVKEDYHFKDMNGNKVWCLRNTTNRWLDLGLAEKYAQDMLHKKWELNGEPLLFTGSISGGEWQVISAQKRLIGIVFANQKLRENPKHYEDLWPDGKVTFRSVVIDGVSDSHDVIRTIDDVQPRTLADVLYTELKAFEGKKPHERRAMTKMTENAMKCLWTRMGIKDAFVERLTHSEAVEFLKRHNKVFAAVEHVYGEDKDKAIGNWIAPGYASGLLYLFAASDTEPDVYFAQEPHDRKEKFINFDQWDRACEFFTCLAEAIEFQPVRDAIGDLFDPDTGSGGRLSEKETILIKAWNRFKQEEDQLVADPPIDYVVRNGIKALAEWPTAGGIDIGKSDRAKKRGPAGDPEVTRDDVANGKKAIKEAKLSGAVLATKLSELREKHKGKVLLFEDGKYYRGWAEDADLMVEEFGLSLDRSKPEWGDVKRASFNASDLVMNLDQLHRLKKRVALVTGDPLKPGAVRDMEPAASVSGKKPTPKPMVEEGPAEAPKPEPVKKGGVRPVRVLRGGTN